MGPFKVIAYFTEGNGYEAEADKLQESLDYFGIDHHIQPVANFGSWMANTNYKPHFVHDMMEQYPDTPLVYTDVDSVFQQYPKLFEELDCDFACHIRNGQELLSGTMYFEDNDYTNKLIMEWKFQVSRFPETWEQKNLHQALKRIQEKYPLCFQSLPATYCQIFDIMKNAGEPVIEHFQASRRLKHVNC